MPPARRSTDRRRRVLYHAHTAPQIPTTAAAKRAAEELREARQPGGAFGSRVHQRLRGRWFSLVPVSRFSLWAVLAVLALVPITLTGLHHLAFNWPSLAYRDEIARPLQIQRPDSIAAWWMSLVLLAIAGASWLIFALREHRRDDYRGHYRLWRLVMIVTLLASAHATIGLVAWLGAGLDLIFGDRAALSGANWLRLVLDVGGIILLMRLVVEVARCRSALVAMTGVAACFGYFEAAAWNVVIIDSPIKATWVTAAPMTGASILLAACTIYLRALFREVRNIGQEPSIASRIGIWFRGGVETESGLSVHRPGDDGNSNSDAQETRPRTSPVRKAVQSPTPTPLRKPPAASQPVVKKVIAASDESDNSSEVENDRVKKPGFFARLRRKPPAQYAVGGTADDKEAGVETIKQIDDGSESESEESTPQRKRRLFGLLPAKRDPEESADEDSGNQDAVEAVAQQDTDEGGEDTPKKKGWLGKLFARKPKAETEEDVEGESADDAPKKKGWLGRLFARKPKAETEEDELADDAEQKPTPKSPPNAGPLSRAASEAARREPVNDDEALENPDDIDWDSLSKSERRRLRKKLKRSGQAA